MSDNGEMTKDVTIAVRVSKELKAALEAAAEAEMRSPGNLVTKVLTEYLHSTGHLVPSKPKPAPRKGR